MTEETEETQDVASPQTKQCPYCAETILKAAIKCRYCGSDLAANAQPPAAERPAPHLARREMAYICSECSGFLAYNATSCKHCGVTFSGPPDAPPKQTSPVVIIGACLLLLVLVWIGATYRPGAPFRGTVTPTRYATLVGYDEVTTGTHVTEIRLFAGPASSPPPHYSVGIAHEGDRVGVLEEQSDGSVRVRTDSGVEGWTQIDALKP